ncbi:hypothetical protein R0131_02970 [Clostridium sp. AL.422]|uniref:hypothetical protein n=1 Tax=Clostridium TaxID=1485 RepID=UPI00293DBB6D|nr:MULTISPECIES: hypothetical protein [unclassified Clostridium]MDV4149790.1 hypothetical protein [Clostridium sp. AL.422]
MNFKIGEMETKKIVKNIFIIGIIYLVINALGSSILLFNTVPAGTKLIYFIYILDAIGTPIIGLFALRLVCEIVYKILKVLAIVIQNHSNREE